MNQTAFRRRKGLTLLDQSQWQWHRSASSQRAQEANTAACLQGISFFAHIGKQSCLLVQIM